MEVIWIRVSEVLNKLYQLPVRIKETDIIEIILISFLIYHIMVWIRNTRAWVLVKGIAVLLALTLLAELFHLSTIIWLAEKTLGIGITAIIIVFQPELRKALEQLGKKNLILGLLPNEEGKNVRARFGDEVIVEIRKAAFELSKTKTGALIVIEREDPLIDFEMTGIRLDALISSQLLINIFEHNTPLHDGAVILRNDRIVSATCYLPLSDNLGLSKELGTRHRAGVGISEVSDSTTIIVSEETGKISVAIRGKLLRNVDGELLKKKMGELQGKSLEGKEKKSFSIRKGVQRIKLRAVKKEK